ncbi:hypothetical protein [Arthrobacter sp. NPDC056727]|uniref:hypothetical protein n=1 Tax=Arthrobacter sp. NPDC056727 TaxID=3345927 RepID=UPI00366FC67F
MSTSVANYKPTFLLEISARKHAKSPIRTVASLMLATVAAVLVALIVGTAKLPPLSTDSETLLALQKVAAQELAQSSSVRVSSLPQDGSEGLHLAPGFVMKPSNVSKESRGSEIAPGVVSYGQVASQTNLVAQELPDGATRFMTVLSGSNAPENYTYQVDMPEGTTMKMAPSGGVDFINHAGQKVGSIGAPWARDAKGVAVETYYTIKGSQLVQTTKHAGAAYPVVADPIVIFVMGYMMLCMVGGGLAWILSKGYPKWVRIGATLFACIRA